MTYSPNCDITTKGECTRQCSCFDCDAWEGKAAFIEGAKLQAINKCGHCGAEIPEDEPSGFCSIDCELAYGECPDCGAPSKNNKQCYQCRLEYMDW